MAAWSPRWRRESFCKSLKAGGGILLQNSRGRGPYLLQTDNRARYEAARSFEDRLALAELHRELGEHEAALQVLTGAEWPEEVSLFVDEIRRRAAAGNAVVGRVVWR